jgi:alpha-1,3-rhamnosyl/mannosyltransferase
VHALIEVRQGRKVTGIGRYGLRLAQELLCLAPQEVTAAVSKRHVADLAAVAPHSVLGIGDKDDLAATLPSGFDVVHGINFHAPELNGAARVATIHDLGFIQLPECHPAGMPERLDRAIRQSLPSTAIFLCDSDWTMRTFVDQYGVDVQRCRVVHLGVDTRFSPEGPGIGRNIRLGIRRVHRPYLLHVGAMIKRKDIGTLLRAFELVAPQNPDLQLVLVGNKTRRWASEWPTVRTWLRDNRRLRGRVRILNYTPDDLLPRLYRDASAVVSTSLLEGFGLTVLEGLASGVPVVATRGSAIDEIAGPNVFLGAARQPESYAEAIKLALASDAATRERGVNHATSFTWKGTAEKTLDAYRAAT